MLIAAAVAMAVGGGIITVPVVHAQELQQSVFVSVIRRGEPVLDLGADREEGIHEMATRLAVSA